MHLLLPHADYDQDGEGQNGRKKSSSSVLVLHSEELQMHHLELSGERTLPLGFDPPLCCAG